MKRVALIFDLTESSDLFADMTGNSLPEQIKGVISRCSLLETAWLDLLVEIPETVSSSHLSGLLNQTDEVDWVHFISVAEETRHEILVAKLRSLGSEAVGFIEGNEILPRGAVFRWVQTSSKVEGMLPETGAVLVSLPAVTLISPTRFVEDAHHRLVWSTTIAFFVGDALDGLLATPRRDWDSNYSGVSDPKGGTVLVACADSDLDDVGLEDGVQALTWEKLEALADEYDVAVSVLETIWSNESVTGSV